MIQKALRKVDIFGMGFGFTINKEEKYKTAIGGTLTFCTITLISIFTIFFGQDFFYRIHPSVYQSTFIPEKYDPPIALTPENFTIAWRIEGFEKYPVDFTNIIYPVTTQFQMKRKDNSMQLTNINFLQPTKCSAETTKMEGFTKFNNISEWYCMDFQNGNLTFGGFFDGDYVNAFNVLLFLCSSPYVPFDPLNNKNCTSTDAFEKFAFKHKRLQISVMYPEYYFASEDLENPLRISFKNYYYYFNLKTFKIDRFFFNKVVLEDDQGWIFDGTKTQSILSYSKLQSDQNINEMSNRTNSEFYEFNLYMDKGTQKIRRSFMKIQDVSAKVGGIIEIIMRVFFMLDMFFSSHYFHVSIFQKIFSFPEEGLESNLKLTSYDLKYLYFLLFLYLLLF